MTGTDRPGEPRRQETVVRRAAPSDVDLVMEVVTRLLRELSGVPDRTLAEASRSAAEELLGDPSRGLVLLADLDHAPARASRAAVPVGILTASFPFAVRTAGRYALIEELFVSPQARGAGVGAALVSGLLGELATAGIRTVEVGLPSHRFAQEPRTRSFYSRQGFRSIGLRMRLQSGDTA
ncbi:GNAT family N-acetyltransferase [Micromonospora sp. NBC_01740]|uniref:GNAT family N-acetyltransferase n=1 Tax=Micromonospora sp. NBC_01740 TaxID=2975986 RepID=UPI002E14E932|nr:GNAT family N-acetyltransferase [Micromonospora sp. NBC_01740]